MSVTTQNNILDVFVAKNTTPTAGTSMTNDLATSMAEGQIVVTGFDPSVNAERALNLISATPTLATTPYIRFVQKINGELYYGSKIYGKDITAVSTKATAAFAEQSYILGYNGSSGSFDVSQANEFILTIAYDHDDMMWSEQKLRNAYDYYSPAPTQQGLAFSMASQINYKENLGALNGTGRMVRAEILSNGTAADWTGAATNIKVTQDSASVIFTNGSGVAAAGQALTDGTLINILGTTYTVSGTGTTAGFTLNMPYQGASAEPAGGTTQATQAGVLSTVTAFGVKITGQALTWKKDFFKYNKVKFHFDLKGFGTTTLTKTTESSKGIGYYQEVAELESFAAGNQGALNRMVVPLPTGRIMTDINTAAAASGYDYYNVWYIESRDTNNYSPIVANTPMRIQTMLFFPDSTNGNNAQTYIGDVNGSSGQNLDSWLTSAGFTFPSTGTLPV